jgi:hypothetical protein
VVEAVRDGQSCSNLESPNGLEVSLHHHVAHFGMCDLFKFATEIPNVTSRPRMNPCCAHTHTHINSYIFTKGQLPCHSSAHLGEIKVERWTVERGDIFEQHIRGHLNHQSLWSVVAPRTVVREWVGSARSDDVPSPPSCPLPIDSATACHDKTSAPNEMYDMSVGTVFVAAKGGRLLLLLAACPC